MKFKTTLRRFGPNNTGIEVPEEILVALGRGRRVKVVATVNGYTYRTSVGPAYGKILMPFSSGHRAASGLSGGEDIEVELVPDDAPREVEVPADLAAALADAPNADAFFGSLSYTNKRAYVLWIEDAKKPETRAARVAKARTMLSESQTR
ncbi:MAG: YdeI/OmpD-associated family protein [Candidatus Limnocylindrales bacterium]